MPTLFKRSNGFYYISFEEEGKRRWKSTGQRQKTAALKELISFEKKPTSTKPTITLQEHSLKIFSSLVRYHSH